jgi:hypothetical protein
VTEEQRTKYFRIFLATTIPVASVVMLLFVVGVVQGHYTYIIGFISIVLLGIFIFFGIHRRRLRGHPSFRDSFLAKQVSSFRQREIRSDFKFFFSFFSIFSALFADGQVLDSGAEHARTLQFVVIDLCDFAQLHQVVPDLSFSNVFVSLSRVWNFNECLVLFFSTNKIRVKIQKLLPSPKEQNWKCWTQIYLQILAQFKMKNNKTIKKSGKFIEGCKSIWLGEGLQHLFQPTIEETQWEATLLAQKNEDHIPPAHLLPS